MAVLRPRRSKRQYVRCTFCTPVDRREALESMHEDYADLLRQLEDGRRSLPPDAGSSAAKLPREDPDY